MSCGKRSAIGCFSFSLLLIAGAKAIVPDAPGNLNPYQGITTRNIFALRPLPLVPPPPPPENKPPVKITLSGLTDILGKRQALLKAQIPPRPPAEPAHEESYILTEGQSEGDIEVISIDQKAGTVKVKNHGMVQTLDFVNNGAKLPAASALPPPAPVMPPVAMMHPVQQPTPPASENPNVITLKSQIGSITPEEQTVLMEQQRATLLDKGDTETANLLPPTDLTDQLLQRQTPAAQ